MWASLVQFSRVSYEHKIHEFSRFRLCSHLPEVWPVPVEQLMRFILDLHDRGLAANFLPVYLAAITFQSKVWGYTDRSGDFRVRRIIEGLRRGSPPIPDRWRPVTIRILSQLQQRFITVCSSPFEATLCSTASLLFFFRALHPSELLALSRTRFDWALQWEDCFVRGKSLSICLRRSKMDQGGWGRWIRLQRATGMTSAL